MQQTICPRDNRTDTPEWMRITQSVVRTGYHKNKGRKAKELVYIKDGLEKNYSSAAILASELGVDICTLRRLIKKGFPICGGIVEVVNK